MAGRALWSSQDSERGARSVLSPLRSITPLVSVPVEPSALAALGSVACRIQRYTVYVDICSNKRRAGVGFSAD